MQDTFYTIKGFTELTQQQMFDMAARHLLTTGVKSRTEDGTGCAYTGSGCAASVFLKPECIQAAENKLNTSWGELVDDYQVAPDHNRGFVVELQCAHDNAFDGDAFLASWKGNMLRVSENYGLDASILDS